jgi:hypothetical protein
VVPHRGTNWAALWLTAQIERDAVLSESYGRGWQPTRVCVYMSFLIELNCVISDRQRLGQGCKGITIVVQTQC